MENAAIIQTVILGIIAILMVAVAIIIYGTASKINGLVLSLKPAIDNVRDAAAGLIPVIENIRSRNEKIGQIIDSLPETIENYNAIAENIKPLTDDLADQTPQIKESMAQILSVAGNLKDQADELMLRVAPTYNRINGVVQAFSEGLRFFKAYTKRK